MTSQIIFFDTETTGNEQKDYLCQIAYKTESETFEALFKPPVPISIESMAVHHITEKMVIDKPSFKESKEYKNIKDLFENENSILVAHNAKFDIEMIKKEDIIPKRTICTLRVARYLDKDGVIPNYRLQFLRYYLGIEIEATAHDALGDVLVLEKLFERLLNKIMTEENLNRDQALFRMEEISNTPSVFRIFTFGKYKNIKIEEVVKNDKGYLEWMLNEKTKADTEDDEDWIYTLKHFLGK